jgi:hypothetical protein
MLRAVEMKNRIQSQLREEQKGLSDEEIERRHRQWLETSDDPLAKWWRSVDRTQPNS